LYYYARVRDHYSVTYYIFWKLKFFLVSEVFTSRSLDTPNPTYISKCVCAYASARARARARERECVCVCVCAHAHTRVSVREGRNKSE